jgi:hypothetical protein
MCQILTMRSFLIKSFRAYNVIMLDLVLSDTRVISVLATYSKCKLWLVIATER